MPTTGLPTRADMLVAARQVLEAEPDCVVRYRLLRDVMGVADGPELRAARRAVLKSPQVTALAAEQRSDGSWGALHSRPRNSADQIGTTEMGVARALALGLGPRDAVLRKAAAHLSAVLKRKHIVADRAERNDRWPTGVELFAAATLARFRPDARVLDAAWRRWAEILRRVMANGTFDADAEITAHADLHGIRDGVGYLTLRNHYTAMLLGARAAELPLPLREAYVRWVWTLPGGLGYVDVACWPPPAELRGHRIAGWLWTMNLLLQYNVCIREIGGGIAWLWDQRTPQGLWDFGPTTQQLRLSPDWRSPLRRTHDHTVAPLALTANYLHASKQW